MTQALQPLQPTFDSQLTLRVGDQVVMVGGEVSVEQAYPTRMQVRVLQRFLADYAAWLESIIAADMEERGATERVVDGQTYEFKGEPQWVYDALALMQALTKLEGDGVITSDEYQDVVKCEPQPDKITIHQGKLNSLCKRRGTPVSEVVNRYRTQLVRPPTLKVKP